MDGLLHDVRYAIRTLRKSPGFTAVAVLTLALGIGATTAVFSLVNGVLLHELPVKDPQRLVTISSQSAISQGRPAGNGWSYPMWSRLHDRQQAFDGVFAWMPAALNIATHGDMQIVAGLITTSDFFKTLGVPAARGRTFTAGDDRRGGGPDGPVAVVSDAFWQDRLLGAGNVVGAGLPIEGVPFTIVGVTPAGFSGVDVGHAFDVALTFGEEPLIRKGAAIDEPNGLALIPMLRLKSGQTLEGATASIRALQSAILGPGRVPPSLQEPFVLVPAPTGTSAIGPGMSGLRQQYQRPLWIVLLIVGVLLLIACANIANLVLIRAEGRAHEFSIRFALGASRMRLLAQLLVEHVVLGVTGALAGLLLAGWSTRALVRQMSAIDARISLALPFDVRLLAFASVVTLLTVVLFGAAPAVRAARGVQVDPTKVPDRHRRSPSGGPSGGLVMAQVALSLVLLVAAGLFVRTVSRLAAVPLGFNPNEVLLVTVDTSRASLGTEARHTFYARLVAAVSALPGVASAAASTSIPISGGFGRLKASTADRPDAEHVVLFNVVSPRWFGTYGTPFVAGRDFDERDSTSTTPVVIINETMARDLFESVDPVGKQLLGGPTNWPHRLVVGVVRDAVYHSARTAGGAALRDPVVPTMYIPLAQSDGLLPTGMSRIMISVRPAAGSPSRLVAVVGASLTAANPDVSFSFRTLADVVSEAFAQERLTAMLSGTFGTLALFLCSLGLYGVSSYAVARRRTEIGVRVALGAPPHAVFGLILRRVAFLTCAGIIEGVVLSFWVLGIVSSLLFGVSPGDPTTLIAAIVTVVVIGVLSGAWPAWRAARVDPMVALRGE